MTADETIFIFGEVLVDEFPSGERVLGGAPFNVAWHLTGFGQPTRLVSRIGEDRDGDLIRSRMGEWRMDLSQLQTDEELPTGSVAVTLEGGQPRYEILQDRAYDAIDGSRLGAAGCALLYHGTLALRSAPSRRALERLKRDSEAPVFMDVNLRDPWWNLALAQRLADDATWVKLNVDELMLLNGRNDDVRSVAERFLRAHCLTAIIVTRGENGAIALTDQGDICEVVPEPVAKLVDTVGAGDAFTAVMLLGLVRGWPLGNALTRAQAFASEVVQNRGAILQARDVYDRLTVEWQL